MENFFRAIILFGLVALVMLVANAASAVQYSQVDWGAEFDWSDVGCSNAVQLTQIDWGAKRGEWSAVGGCDIHDRCLVISNCTSGNVSHRNVARPQISSKVYKLEKKNRKPIKVVNKIRSGGRELDMDDPKAYAKFWEASLEEQKRYPLTLRRKFVHTRRARKLRAEYDEWRKKNPNRPPPPLNPRQEPYTEEEKAILGTDDRRLTRGEIMASTRDGKVSNQSKIGNKTINLEVR